ncbi:hypothetical protein [Klebsiella aerogenes]|uniref:hypothetical protein n=1 Tax=Klebsiella aerogenes TaxID=548 RepID=UPI001CC700A7|nr:hypothetical protein [Klebsiella aerogenes]UNX66909.1 hypothetical protein MQE04_18275 [Klebsiella aerogenes]HCR0680455.1 hypothetical protein [Klebsiella aerogenes]
MSWSDLFGFASPTGAEAVPNSDPALQVGISPEDVANIDGAAVAAPAATGGDSGAWYTKALKGIMPTLAGAALKPHQQVRAPVAPSGHGVNVNTAGLMKPIDELRSSANNNPLADINKWAGLFK